MHGPTENEGNEQKAPTIELCEPACYAARRLLLTNSQDASYATVCHHNRKDVNATSIG